MMDLLSLIPDPAYDLLRPPPLGRLFAPRTVAVVADTAKAQPVLAALGDFRGQVYMVDRTNAAEGTPSSPDRSGDGQGASHSHPPYPTYPTVQAIPAAVDLVIFPAAVGAATLADCATAQVGAMVGLAPAPEPFPPIVPPLRLLGPRGGLVVPRRGLNVGPLPHLPAEGNLAFLSQSPAMTAAVLDWAAAENVGFSAVATVGDMADVGWGDLIDYLGDDPHTHSIMLYLETLGDARRFLSAAREVALSKPVMVLKPRGAAAAETALDGAFRRCGVLRVDTLGQLFDLAEGLAKQDRLPQGLNLGIVTNASGPGWLAVDALVAGGGHLADLAPATQTALASIGAIGKNPVVVPHLETTLDGEQEPPGDHANDSPSAHPYAQALRLALADPHTDGVLALLVPQAGVDPVAVAQALVPLATATPKPVLASWMGGPTMVAATDLLNQAAIPTYAHPDEAAQIFTAMGEYGRYRQALYETPLLAFDDAADALARRQVATLIHMAQAQQRLQFTPTEAAAVAGAYALGGTPPPGPAEDETTCPLRLASHLDAQLGPVLEFGVGGHLAAYLPQPALGLPPLTTTLAHRLIERSPVYAALATRPGTLAQVASLLVRFSQLVVEHPAIAAFTLDPLPVSPGGLGIAPATLTLHPHPHPLPRPAIRPYPSQYISQGRAKDGRPVTLRPIRPEDEPALVAFHQTLSERSVYLRYFHLIKLSQRTAHQRLTRICFIDYDREMALVAVGQGTTGDPAVLAVGRLSRLHGTRTAEFAMVVGDPYQNLGLGRALLGRLVDIARQEGLERITADVLAENRAMRHLFQGLGFTVQPGEEGGMTATLVLTNAEVAP